MKKAIGFSFAIMLLIQIHSCKKEAVPVVITNSIINLTATTATSGGSITKEGSSTVISRGICWSKGTTPTINDSKTTDGAGAGNFVSNLTGLIGATNYFIRAYATNSAGTGYGMALSFTTLGQSPTSIITEATNINVSSATLNGTVNPNYLSTSVTFEYGITLSYGNSVTPSQSIVTGNSVTNVSADISGLSAGTIYHFRIKSVNSLGTTYSDDLTFTTLGQIPTVITLSATNLATTTATLNGSVNANYLSSNVSIEFGINVNYGSVAIAAPSTVTGNSITSISANLTGLLGGTTYHYRVRATNSLGTNFGNDMTFTTKGPVKDFEGNSYNIVTIGTQIWMAENLRTIKYSNGDVIGTTTSPTLDISGESSPKYQWASNGDESKVPSYGRLYTWDAIIDNRNVCPIGWHVPSNEDWTTLENYLIAFGYNFDGTISGNKIAKSLSSLSEWMTSTIEGAVGNSDFTNKRNLTGFSGLPGGRRIPTGVFDTNGYSSHFWSSTASGAGEARQYILHYTGIGTLSGEYDKKIGCNVRCIKD